MAINCTLCGKPTEASNTYTKNRKHEPNYALPFGWPTSTPKGSRATKGVVVCEGICDWCSMLIAGYIESLRKPPV